MAESFELSMGTQTLEYWLWALNHEDIKYEGTF